MTGTSQARYIAFYSYKGGVGRTLALANCARALAAEGKTVLILDLDLEAPGLEMFPAFRPECEVQPSKDEALPALSGFAEYLNDCRRQAPPPSLTPYLHACRGEKGDRGKVYLMPAGEWNSAAYRDILSLDWDRFYREEDGYRVMENLRGHIAHNIGPDEQKPIQPDYVLMDARTGRSETGGIATHQLADLVVMLFSLNRQNLEGSARVHDSLRRLPEPPKTLLVISPLPDIMETGKGSLFQERRNYIRRHFQDAENCDAPATLPYRPVLSWEERIFVDSGEDEYLGYDRPYRQLLALILETLGAAETFLEKATGAWSNNDLDGARKHLEAGLARYPEHPGLSEALLRLGIQTEAPRIDITHLPSGAPHFLGRSEEMAQLDAAWASEGKTAIVELIAPGGVGKSALAKRWVDSLRNDGWRGARRVFAWSFYSQGTSDDRQASEDHFLGEALKWFGVTIAKSANPADKGRALAEELGRSRTLLVLDGLEPLQYPPGPLAGELRAPGVKTLLTHAASFTNSTCPGLILLTSREWLKDLDEWVSSPSHPAGPVLRHDLSNLSPADGGRLLHAEGARRAGDEAIKPEDEELQAASAEVKGHALTLTLLSRYLALAFEGDIRRRIEVKFQEADAQTTRGHAFRVIEAYERWFQSQGRASELAALRLLGFFDRPASKENLAALTAQPAIPGLTEALAGLAPAQWRANLKRLEDCRLIEPVPETGGLDAHPLVREYFAAALAQGQPAAWKEGHRRLYEQLKRDTPPRPDTLAGLQPLYQAVAHGCKAGLAQEACDEVYDDRILRGTGHDGFYSSRKLGAFGADLGAIACFFMEPWRWLAPELKEGDQAWLLNQAAFRLRALGRLTEALEPMRVGAEMAVRQEDWKNAAITYNNLSELELSLGRVKEAVADAGRSVEYADLSGDAFERLARRTALADARQQQGQLDAARQAFAEAEAMQAKYQPQYPLLYSLPGFQYCELLLAPAERAMWVGIYSDMGGHSKEDVGINSDPQAVARGNVARRSEASPGPGPSPGSNATPAVDSRTRLEASSGLRVCAEVAKRAAQTLEWADRNNAPLLDFALNHLTLARCALYADLLQGLPPGEEARQQCEAANSGLRASGRTDELPRALLTRAWLRHAARDLPGAQGDLEEAYQIASRGGMKLFLADTALTRARLFRDEEQLALARKLIEEIGYNRRLPELQDAETALAQTSP